MTRVAWVLTWVAVSACGASLRAPGKSLVPPMEQKDMIGLELDTDVVEWRLANPSESPVFAPRCGALTVQLEWRTRDGWEEAPTFLLSACGGCSSNFEAVMAGTSARVWSCNTPLVAGEYRGRIRLVDANGKVFDLVRLFEVTGLSEEQSDAFVDALVQPEALACLRFEAFREVVHFFAWIGTRRAVRRLRDVRTGDLGADAAILEDLADVPDGVDDLAVMAERADERALAAQVAFSATRPCRHHPDLPLCKKIIEGWLARPVSEELIGALTGALPWEDRNDAALLDHLIDGIPTAPADALPRLLYVLFDNGGMSREQKLRALPLMKRRQWEVTGAARCALVEAIATAQLPPNILHIGRPPQRIVQPPPAACGGVERRLTESPVFADARAMLESKGHLPMKTVEHATATWTGRAVASPSRVLACEHPIRVCE